MMIFVSHPIPMQILFWVLSCVIFYTYLGYPFFVCALSSSRPKKINKRTYTPTVSILIAAYNEEVNIGRTIQNKLELDYPKDKLEIILVSDASVDATDMIVERFSEQTDGQVTLLRQHPRNGKTSALNMAAPRAAGEIVVFSDANSIYAKDVLLKLMRNFADPEVGYVTGKMLYGNPDGTSIGEGSSSYMKYENFIRSCENQLGSIVGVDGGIDAIRKELYIEMRPDQLPDLILPLSVVERGYRVVYEAEALLQEPALDRLQDEYAMRVRVALRALWALSDMRKLFNPFRYGVYSWQLLSHKAIRYLTFLPVAAVLVLNVFLWSVGLVYQVLLVLQLAFYLLAFLGPRIPRPAWLGLPRYFVLLNAASAHAFWKFLKREKKAVWSPRTG